MRTRLTVFFLWAAAALFTASAAGAASSLPVQSSSQAAVTVKATPRMLSGESWEFELVFDTHTRELTDDLEKAATLITDAGVSHSPVTWQGDPPGGHHRKGVLRFKAISPMPQAIELRITRPGESAPRSFRWQLK